MRRLFLLCSLTGEFFFGTTAQSQLPGVNLSATSFLDGLPPPDGPGLYGEQYFQYHNSSRLLDHEGNEIALPTSRGTREAPRVQAWVMLTQLFNQTRDLAEGALASQPHRSCCRDRRKPPADFIGFQEQSCSFGDIFFGPFVQWHPTVGKRGPFFAHQLTSTLFSPPAPTTR